VAQSVKLLNNINKSLNITLIFATHDVDVVPLLADRIYVMNRGRIRVSGTTSEVFSQKEIIRDNNLRLPRVAHLVELLQRDGFPAPGANHGQCGTEPETGPLPMTIGQARRLLESRIARQYTNAG
jgi:cobalt/nickel transport system ATP-binding protein